MIKAEVIADSLSPHGERLTSIVGVLPRIVLAELNTHRMFSRNSASSRAVPTKKMIKMVLTNPFIPIAFQKEHSGMQGTEYYKEDEIFSASEAIEIISKELLKDEDDKEYIIQLESIFNRMHILFPFRRPLAGWWLTCRDLSVMCATLMLGFRVSKQLCNRLLEPFMYHTVIITASEWENFFKLRCPQYNIDNVPTVKINGFTTMDWLICNKSQAEIHIQAFAEAVWDAMNESKPRELKAGQWHIPFGDNLTTNTDSIGKLSGENYIADDVRGNLIKIATARCARVSYINYEGKDDYEADIKLYDTLIKNGHASPLEHCARAMSAEEHITFRKLEGYTLDLNEIAYSNGWCRNFKGFIQQRFFVEK